jgi:cyclase
MFKKKLRIIPRLDIRNNFLIKPIQCEGVRKIGDPIIFADKYFNDNADELIVMDNVATLYGRYNKYDLIRKISDKVSIPMTVGGGIKSIEDGKKLFDNGADKIAINSIAFKKPKVVYNLARIYGSQSIVLSIETKKIQNKWETLTNNGRDREKYDLIRWIKNAKELGAGEILLTSIDNQGTNFGLNFELIEYSSKYINIPLIISGGMSNIKELSTLYKLEGVNAVAIAKNLHNNTSSINEIKRYAQKVGFDVRLSK